MDRERVPRCPSPAHQGGRVQPIRPLFDPADPFVAPVGKSCVNEAKVDPCAPQASRLI